MTPLSVKVWPKTRKSLSLGVLISWDFLTAYFGIFCTCTYTSIHIRCCFHNNWSWPFTTSHIFHFFSKYQRIVEKQLHNKKKITVWYILWSRGVIWLYLFESNVSGETVSVNSARYDCMKTNFFKACSLKKLLGQYVISTRWCYIPKNMSKCGFIVREVSGSHKSLVFAISIRHRDRMIWQGWTHFCVATWNNVELLTNIKTELLPKMCQKVAETYPHCTEVCKNSWDGPLKDLLFQMHLACVFLEI